jgi:hypothetical protein
VAIQWTDAVLNAQAAGSWSLPDTVKAHTGDPGAAGTANVVSGSDTALTWETPGVEGPLGASQPATAGKSYAAPSITLADDATWLSFWDGATFQGRVQLAAAAPAGTFQPSLALTA